MLQRLFAFLFAAIVMCSCSSAPTAQTLLQQALAAMGGVDKLRGIRSITLKDGSGSRWRLGQTVHVADAESASELRNVVEIVDLEGKRASLDYQIRDGAFVQHRHETLTARGGKPIGLEVVETRPVAVTSASGLFSWGSQNSPDFLLRRNAISIMLAAADSTSSAMAIEDSTFDGKPASAITTRTNNGDSVKLYFDRQTKLLSGFDVVDTEAILGDVQAQYSLGDYKTVDGVTVPLHINVRKAGKDYSDVHFGSVAINAPDAEHVLTIPDAATGDVDIAMAAGPDYSPLAITKVADGVYFARGYSHHSLVVEFPKSLVVVEAPYTEAQSKTLLRLLGEHFPGKPIQYVAVTHPHYDHIGGVRAIVATGATALVAKGHEPELRMLIETPHTHPPDALEATRKAGQQVGSIETFDDKRVIADANQRLELYAFAGSPHVEPMVLAFVPSGHVLFQSDLWFPGAGSNGSAGAAAAKQILDTIHNLGLSVETNVGGHGGVAPFAEFVKAVAAAPKAVK